jgi:hypothetical protein
MAQVVFALGDRPELSQDDALELAEQLRQGASFAAQSASRKIRFQASRDPDRGEVSKNIELDRDELAELEAVLAQERHPELSGFERLQNGVHQALREGPPPTGQYGS